VLPLIDMNNTELVESVEAYSIFVVRFPVEIEEAYSESELKLVFRPVKASLIPVESVENPS
jgi:hypothetical protein